MKATYLNGLCPLLPNNLTKGQLADYRLGDMTYDFALPQVWLDAYVNDHAVSAEERKRLYWELCSECVTVYPPGHSLDGEIVDLVTGEVLT